MSSGLESQFTFPAKVHIEIKKISGGEDKVLGPDVNFWKLFMVSLISNSSKEPGLKFSFLKQQVFDFCSEMATR